MKEREIDRIDRKERQAELSKEVTNYFFSIRQTGERRGEREKRQQGRAGGQTSKKEWEFMKRNIKGAGDGSAFWKVKKRTDQRISEEKEEQCRTGLVRRALWVTLGRGRTGNGHHLERESSSQKIARDRQMESGRADR